MALDADGGVPEQGSGTTTVRRTASVSLPPSPALRMINPGHNSVEKSPPEIVRKLAKRALTIPADVGGRGSNIQHTGPTATDEVLAPAAETATNIMLLVSLTLLDMLQRDVLKHRAPDKVNRTFKRATAMLYDVEALLNAVVAVCGGTALCCAVDVSLFSPVTAVYSMGMRCLGLVFVREVELAWHSVAVVHYRHACRRIIFVRGEWGCI